MNMQVVLTVLRHLAEDPPVLGHVPRADAVREESFIRVLRHASLHPKAESLPDESSQYVPGVHQPALLSGTTDCRAVG